MQQVPYMKRTLSLLFAIFVTGPIFAQSIDLPAPQKSGGMPLMDALAKRSTAREFDPRELSPRELSSLLWASFGINRPDGKRTAPSAKNCQETDLYVILKQGAYLYDAKSNKLNLVFRLVVQGIDERAPDHRGDAQPGRRGLVPLPVDALGVLAQRGLQAGRLAEHHLVHGAAPAFDGHRL